MIGLILSISVFPDLADYALLKLDFGRCMLWGCWLSSLGFYRAQGPKFPIVLPYKGSYILWKLFITLVALNGLMRVDSIRFLNFMMINSRSSWSRTLHIGWWRELIPEVNQCNGPTLEDGRRPVSLIQCFLAWLQTLKLFERYVAHGTMIHWCVSSPAPLQVNFWYRHEWEAISWLHLYWNLWHLL